MKNTINQLKEISKTSNERAQRNINNLIGRIKSFEGNQEKLNECLGEAQLWGAK